MSGRYSGACRGHRYAVDLRIDVDGPNASQRISADIFDVTTKPATYRGSLVVDAPERADEPGGVTLAGRGSFTSATASSWIEVRIPRSATAARATLARFEHRNGRPGPVYECRFRSPYLRRVELTEDCEQGVDAVDEYDASVLPGGASNRKSIKTAYADAGIDLQVIGERTEVRTAEAGDDAAWSDAELHAAMAKRLDSTVSRDWRIWLLHAHLHKRDLHSDGSQKLLGVMFDVRRRHGCAVFYRWLAGTAPENRRAQLFACVHEIGHAFNLEHCWQQSRLGPPRPDARSWLNIPDGYSRGEQAFWNEFQFKFDDVELVHLRHAFLDDVVMGGRPLFEPQRTARDVLSPMPERRASGLRLRVAMPRELRYGVPATVGLELAATSATRQFVPRVLGPRPGSVDILIRRPSGNELRFEPLLQHCRADVPRALRAGDPPVRDHAFVHCGKQGFAFEESGTYEVRARHVTADGRVVLSEPVRTTVLPPSSRADRDAQSLLYGDEQGLLMSLMGSGRATLKDGDASLQEFIARHPGHPAAAAARIVRATSAARRFKAVAADGVVAVDDRDAPTATALFGEVVAIDRVRRAVAQAGEGERVARAALELARTPLKRGTPAAIDAFIRSRRHEIAAEIAWLS